MEHLKTFLLPNDPTSIVLAKSDHVVYDFVRSFVYKRIQTYNSMFKDSFYLFTIKGDVCILLHHGYIATYPLTYEGLLRCIRKRQLPTPLVSLPLKHLSCTSLSELTLRIIINTLHGETVIID